MIAESDGYIGIEFLPGVLPVRIDKAQCERRHAPVFPVGFLDVVYFNVSEVTEPPAIPFQVREITAILPSVLQFQPESFREEILSIDAQVVFQFPFFFEIHLVVLSIIIFLFLQSGVERP